MSRLIKGMFALRKCQIFSFKGKKGNDVFCSFVAINHLMMAQFVKIFDAYNFQLLDWVDQ